MCIRVLVLVLATVEVALRCEQCGRFFVFIRLSAVCVFGEVGDAMIRYVRTVNMRQVRVHPSHEDLCMLAVCKLMLHLQATAVGG